MTFVTGGRNIGFLEKACWVYKWVNMTLFFYLELRLKMLAWVLLPWHLCVMSSLLMALPTCLPVTHIMWQRDDGVGWVPGFVALG